MNINLKINDSNYNFKDISEIYEKNNWGAKYDKTLIDTMFGESDFYNIAYDENERVVGFCKALTNTHDTYLTEIIVHPEFQRKGIGRKLMQSFMKNFQHTYIYVIGMSNTEEFFEKFGLLRRSTIFACSKKAIK